MQVNSAEEADLGDLSFAELVGKAGGKPSLSAIEDKLPQWQDEFDKSWYVIGDTYAKK